MKPLLKKTSHRGPVLESAVASELLFQHPSRKVRRTPLRAFWLELTERISPRRAAFCLITGDDELRRMNKQFRGKDYATDVLSFPAQVPALTDGVWGMEGEGLLGEIAISFDRASAQAAELGHGADEELRILMLHGLLHLTGLDHETDTGEMARVETRWRKKLGLPLGLIERSEKPKWIERSETPKWIERSEKPRKMPKDERSEDSTRNRSEDSKRKGPSR